MSILTSYNGPTVVQPYSFIRWLAAWLVLAVLLHAQAAAQGINVISCTDVDASVTSTTPVVVIAGCAVTAGPKGIIIATAQATTTCGTTATETVQLFGGATAPTDGAPVPGSATAMTPLLHQNGCNVGSLITKVTGALVGTAGFLYYITLAISTSTGAQAATWTNQTVKILTY